MKKIFLAAILVAGSLSLSAQNKAYTFTDVKVNPITSIKSQDRAGTCWSYSTMSTIESDVMKRGKGEHDFSEMWIARNTYYERAVKYVRMHGANNLGQGGNAHDVLNMIDKYGLVPEEIYKGLNYGTEVHTHGEVDAVIQAYVKAIVKNPNKKLSTAWKAGLDGILDAYFGVRPEKFTYQGKEYTPKSFAEEMGVKGSDYVTFGSVMHHPYHTMYAHEVPDNWAWGLSYNLPLDEFGETLDYVIEHGGTAFWGSDVSEKGFQYGKGFAVLPALTIESMDNLEQAKWDDMSKAEIASKVLKFEQAVPEIVVTPEMRQEWFDNYESTDDHGMHIYGIAKDQNGKKFYKVKNSWGAGGVYKGSFYVSEPFFLGKTMNFMVLKSYLPKSLRSKLK